jgi:hypothetical protein
VDCREGDLRDAVGKANACADVPGFHRTISFNSGSGCVIQMQQVSAIAACAGDPEANAVCLTGHDITIDGARKVIFEYVGDGLCEQCTNQCLLPQPALFTLKGSNNTVRNLSMEYFPEGIHIREGDGHVVSGVTDDFICEDAITIDETAGSDITISGNTLTGHTAAQGTHVCYAPGGGPGFCGLDKAIQVNGGSSTISGNTIDAVGQAVEVVGGTHIVTSNSTTGSPTDAEVCEGYTATGGTMTMQGNTIRFCKFGIRVVGAASVDASNNVITDGYVSAFDVKDGDGLLKASGNQLRHNGYDTNTSECQRGAVVAKNSTCHGGGNAGAVCLTSAECPGGSCFSGARIDFGGGDASGAPVIGAASTGGNAFCGQGNLTDIWNVTDCTCGAYTDSLGGSASIGAEADCFDSIPANVQDTGPSGTRVTNATVCTAAQCTFPTTTPTPSGPPTISGVVPQVADPGAGVTVTGSNFHAVATEDSLTFNLSIATVDFASPTLLTAEVPTGSTSGRVSIATPDGVGVGADLFVPPSPYVASEVAFAERIDLGATADAAVNVTGAIALVVFDGTAGQQVNLEAIPTTLPCCGNALALYRPDGVLILGPVTIDDGVFLGPQTLPQAGTYTVLVAAGAMNSGHVMLTATTASPIPPTTIPTTSLVLRDDTHVPPNLLRREITFRSLTTAAPAANQIVLPAPASAGDPTLHGAVLSVMNTAGGGNQVSVALPHGEWHGTGTSYVFQPIDKTFPIGSVKLKANSLQVRGGKANWGYNLDEPAQGSIGLRLQLGDGTVWCAEVGEGPYAARIDRPGLFHAQNHTPAPPACP